MKKFMKYALGAMAIVGAFTFTACNNDDDKNPVVMYEQEDQMARPAINTVFIASGTPKDVFNETIPSAMGALYAGPFENVLKSLNGGTYPGNALGQTGAQFAGLLATDVLNVARTGTTTFFDGTNVLTGRTLADDVISVELLLIFGGPNGSSNPTLTDDNVDANDKAFLTTFPYLAAPF
ncbi:MAG: DUF4331 family protein [Cytophagales bacterium]|nr:DUF4331 family protein [Cytophagales bacterium]